MKVSGGGGIDVGGVCVSIPEEARAGCTHLSMEAQSPWRANRCTGVNEMPDTGLGRLALSRAKLATDGSASCNLGTLFRLLRKRI